jgi:hypothetical protein
MSDNRCLASDDGLWVVTTGAGPGSPGFTNVALRSSGVRGELAPEFASALLADPGLPVRIARDLSEATSPRDTMLKSPPRSASTLCR